MTSPLVSGGHVVLALQSGVLEARRLTDGAVAWTEKLAVDQPMAEDGGRLFVFTGNTLHALDVASGAADWSVAVGQPTAPVVARGGWVIVASAESVYGAARLGRRQGLDEGGRGRC